MDRKVISTLMKSVVRNPQSSLHRWVDILNRLTNEGASLDRKRQIYDSSKSRTKTNKVFVWIFERLFKLAQLKSKRISSCPGLIYPYDSK